jgi:hypothetical protein
MTTCKQLEVRSMAKGRQDRENSAAGGSVKRLHFPWLFLVNPSLLMIAAVLFAAAGCAGHRPLVSEPPPLNAEILPEAIEPRPLPSPFQTVEKPPLAEIGHLLEIQHAEWQGVPYRRGGLSRKGIDCSGFVYLTFQERFSVELPRTTEGQSFSGTKIDPETLLTGDLVFFVTPRSGRHVGIYLGDGRFVHASLSRGVIISSMANGYWANHFWQARRVLA